MAIRIKRRGVRILAPLRRGRAAAQDTHRSTTCAHDPRGPWPDVTPGADAPMQTAPAVSSDVTQQQRPSSTRTPSRWFEADSGAAITMYINSSARRAPHRGRPIRQGEAAWSNDPQANFRYARRLHDGPGMRYDGVNAISFNDPDGTMTRPSAAAARSRWAASSEHDRVDVVNGTTLWDPRRDVVFNHAGRARLYETFRHFAEVAAHELATCSARFTRPTPGDMYASRTRRPRPVAQGGHCRAAVHLSDAG